MVAAAQIPVFPTCHKAGCLKQPPYTRSKRTIATSARLISFRSCVGASLSGKKPGNQSAVRSSFASAARSCAGRSAG
jgi:hypothetical protein